MWSSPTPVSPRPSYHKKNAGWFLFYHIMNYYSLVIPRQYYAAIGEHGVSLWRHHVTKKERMIPFPIYWERLFFTTFPCGPLAFLLAGTKRTIDPPQCGITTTSWTLRDPTSTRA